MVLGCHPSEEVLGLGGSHSVLCHYWKDLWSGFAPPKAEIFCWQLLLKKVAVKEELANRAWQETATATNRDKTRKLFFFVIVLSLWLMRNEIIFKGKCFDRVQTIQCIKFRLDAWANAKWPNLKKSNWNTPVLLGATVSPDTERTTTLRTLIAPPIGSLKFNTDGASATASNKAE
ncbi:hypothetical protein REPUB_Repub01dG0045400 [Reevesia pubescens]